MGFPTNQPLAHGEVLVAIGGVNHHIRLGENGIVVGHGWSTTPVPPSAGLRVCSTCRVGVHNIDVHTASHGQPVASYAARLVGVVKTCSTCGGVVRKQPSYVGDTETDWQLHEQVHAA